MRERREFIERYSSLEDRVTLDKDLDFRRKRGMLEEINKAVRDWRMKSGSCARFANATRARIQHPSSQLQPLLRPRLCLRQKRPARSRRPTT